MVLNNDEILSLLNALRIEFQTNDISKIIATVKTKRMGFNNDNDELSFFDDSVKSNFNLDYVRIHSQKNLPTINLSRIKFSDDKKSLKFIDVYGKEKIVPYNNDVFVNLENVPLDVFLFHIWYNV